MSRSDTGQQADTGVVEPVVLVFNETGGVKYLEDESGLLEALYGRSPIRLDVNIANELLHPDSSTESTQLAFFRRFSAVSWSSKDEFIEREVFYDELVREIIAQTAFNETYIKAIRAIVVHDSTLENSIYLVRAIMKGFPDVAVFTVPSMGRGRPTKVDLRAFLPKGD